jgi:hypothetical protein
MYMGRNYRDSRSVLRYVFGRTVQAAFSTIDIGGILSNVANKFLSKASSASSEPGATSRRCRT